MANHRIVILNFASLANMAQVRKQNFNAAPMGNVLRQGISGNRRLPVAIQSNSSSPGPSLTQNYAGGNNDGKEKVKYQVEIINYLIEE